MAEYEFLMVADASLLRFWRASGQLPVGAAPEEFDLAFDRMLDRARDYERLRNLIENGDAPDLVRLVRSAAPFVNAVAVMAEDSSKALAWLADASAAVGTPDPEYACGAAYCDDPACTTHRGPGAGASDG